TGKLYARRVGDALRLGPVASLGLQLEVPPHLSHPARPVLAGPGPEVAPVDLGVGSEPAWWCGRWLELPACSGSFRPGPRAEQETPRVWILGSGPGGRPGVLQRTQVPAEALADLSALAVGGGIPGSHLERLVQRHLGRLEEARAAHQASQGDPPVRVLRAHLGQALVLEECHLLVSPGELERGELLPRPRVFRKESQGRAKLGAGPLGIASLEGSPGPTRRQ